MAAVRAQRRAKLGALYINNKIYPVYEGLNTIGRHQDATVILKDVGISHHHAVLTIVNGDLQFISDFQSSNGTTVDGVALTPFELKPITDGSVIVFSLKINAVYRKINGDTSTVEQENDQNSQNTQRDNTFYEARTQILTDTLQNSPNVSTFQAFKKPDALFDDGYDFSAVSTQISDALTQVVDIHEVATQITGEPNSILTRDIHEASTSISNQPGDSSNRVSNICDALSQAVDIHEMATQITREPISANTSDIHEASTLIVNQSGNSSNRVSIHEADTQIVLDGHFDNPEEVVIQPAVDEEATQITSFDAAYVHQNVSIHEAETQILIEDATNVINSNEEVVSDLVDDAAILTEGDSSARGTLTPHYTGSGDELTQINSPALSVPLGAQIDSNDSDRLSQLHTSQLRRLGNHRLDTDEEENAHKVTADHSYITDSDSQTQLHTSQLRRRLQYRLLSDSGSSSATVIQEDAVQEATTTSVLNEDDTTNHSEDFCLNGDVCIDSTVGVNISVGVNNAGSATTEVSLQNIIDSDADTDIEESSRPTSRSSNVHRTSVTKKVLVQNEIDSDADTDVDEPSRTNSRTSNVLQTSPTNEELLQNKIDSDADTDVDDMPSHINIPNIKVLNDTNKPIHSEVAGPNKVDSDADTDVDEALPHSSTRLSNIQDGSLVSKNSNETHAVDNLMKDDESSNDSTDFFKVNCDNVLIYGSSVIPTISDPCTSAESNQINNHNVSLQKVSDSESSDEATTLLSVTKKLLSSSDQGCERKEPSKFVFSSDDTDCGDNPSTNKPKLRKKRLAKKNVIGSDSDTDVEGNLNYNSKFKDSVINSTTDIDDSYIGRKSLLDLTTDVIPCTQDCLNDTNDVIPATQNINQSSSSEDTFKLDLTEYMEDRLKEQQNKLPTKLSTFKKIEDSIVSDTEELYVVKGLDTQGVDSDSDDELMNTKLEVASNKSTSNGIETSRDIIGAKKVEILSSISIGDKIATSTTKTISQEMDGPDFNFVAPARKTEKQNADQDVSDIDFDAPTQKFVQDSPKTSKNNSLNNTDFDFEAATQKLTDGGGVVGINKSSDFNDSDFAAPTQKMFPSDIVTQNVNELDDTECDFGAPTQNLLGSQRNSLLKNAIDFNADTEQLTISGCKINKNKDDEFDFAAPTQRLIPSTNISSDRVQLDDSECDIIAPTQDLLSPPAVQNTNITGNGVDFEAPTQQLLKSTRYSKRDSVPVQKLARDNATGDFLAPTQLVETSRNDNTDFDFNASTQAISIVHKDQPIENCEGISNLEDAEGDFNVETEKILDIKKECVTPKGADTSRGNNTDIDFNASTQKMSDVPVDDFDFNASTQKIIHEDKELEKLEEINRTEHAMIGLDEEDLNEIDDITKKSNLEIVATPIIKKKSVSFGSARSASNDEIDDLQQPVEVDQLENKLASLFETPSCSNNIKSVINDTSLSTQDVIAQLISDPAPSKKWQSDKSNPAPSKKRPSDECDDKGKSKRIKQSTSATKEVAPKRTTRKSIKQSKRKASIEEKIEPNKDITNNNTVKQLSPSSTSKSNNSLLDHFNMNNIKRTNISKLSTIKSNSNEDDEEESDSLTIDDDYGIFIIKQPTENKKVIPNEIQIVNTKNSDVETTKNFNDSKMVKLNNAEKPTTATKTDTKVNKRKTGGSKASGSDHAEAPENTEDLNNAATDLHNVEKPKRPTRSTRSNNVIIDVIEEIPTRRATRARGQSKKVDVDEETSESTKEEVVEKPARKTRQSKKATVVENTGDVEETKESKVKPKASKSIARGKSKRTNKEPEEASSSKRSKIEESDEEETFSVCVPRRQIKLQITATDSDLIDDDPLEDRTFGGKSFSKSKSNSTIGSNSSRASTTRGGNSAVRAEADERSKRKIKPKIVFTMLDSPELERIIRSLGGMVVDTLEAATVLVSKSVQRSQKLLCAIGLNKPICSPEWLYRCQRENTFLDPWDNIIQDEEAETKWNFSLEESFNRTRRNKLFKGLHFEVATTKSSIMLKAVIEACGGICFTKTNKSVANFVIVSASEKREKYLKYIEKNIKVIPIEAIFDGSLRQELTFDKHLMT